MRDEEYFRVTPTDVLSELKEAVPGEVLENIIIIGSLAAAYWLLDSGGVRTKDVDCVLSPRLTAVEKGRLIAEKLLEAGWEQKASGEYAKPGTEKTPDDKLPAVRLYPPGDKEWFLELLTEPEPGQQKSKDWIRLTLDTDQHFGIPSLRFLSLAAFEAPMTEFGFRVARPEMMALANLLEHRELRPDLIRGTEVKRCNKDLGRVLAIAYLTRDAETKTLPDIWRRGLQECFPRTWQELAGKSGDGLRALIESPEDMQQALNACANGLLAGKGATVELLKAVGKRILGEVIELLD